jgi:hypothetical protein
MEKIYHMHKKMKYKMAPVTFWLATEITFLSFMKTIIALRLILCYVTECNKGFI